MLAAIATLAAVVGLGGGGADAFLCGCFKNQAEPSLLAIMCTTEYVPSRLLGWGSPVNSWFVVDCYDCGTFNCTKSGESVPVRNVTKHSLAPAAPAAVGAANRAKPRRPAAAAAVAAANATATAGERGSGDSDPVECCGYAKEKYYYTEGIIAEAVHPGGVCEGTHYGSQLMGSWYVDSMFDSECYFITGSTAKGALDV